MDVFDRIVTRVQRPPRLQLSSPERVPQRLTADIGGVRAVDQQHGVGRPQVLHDLLVGQVLGIRPEIPHLGDPVEQPPVGLRSR